MVLDLYSSESRLAREMETQLIHGLKWHYFIQAAINTSLIAQLTSFGRHVQSLRGFLLSGCIATMNRPELFEPIFKGKSGREAMIPWIQYRMISKQTKITLRNMEINLKNHITKRLQNIDL